MRPFTLLAGVEKCTFWCRDSGQKWATGEIDAGRKHAFWEVSRAGRSRRQAKTPALPERLRAVANMTFGTLSRGFTLLAGWESALRVGASALVSVGLWRFGKQGWLLDSGGKRSCGSALKHLWWRRAPDVGIQIRERSGGLSMWAMDTRLEGSPHI